jgi:hypothetical protein
VSRRSMTFRQPFGAYLWLQLGPVRDAMGTFLHHLMGAASRIWPIRVVLDWMENVEEAFAADKENQIKEEEIAAKQAGRRWQKLRYGQLL